VSCDIPKWLPDWLREALTNPVMTVPDAGRAVFGADKGQSYALARRGVIPTIEGSRRKPVPTIWVRQQLMLDDGSAKPNGDAGRWK
jgi:hypothetical protein